MWEFECHSTCARVMPPYMQETTHTPIVLPIDDRQDTSRILRSHTEHVNCNTAALKYKTEKYMLIAPSQQAENPPVACNGCPLHTNLVSTELQRRDRKITYMLKICDRHHQFV